MAGGREQLSDVSIGPHHLAGVFALPDDDAAGMVIFAHGSGSSRLSPRNNQVAAGLREAGFATLLLDLLSPAEDLNRRNVFDIPLLASRLSEAADWTRERIELAALPIGYFGASTGAAAALVSAAEQQNIAAIVSRGGRPDLAGASLSAVCAPTLLIVGGNDLSVLPLNHSALAQLSCEKELVIVPGSGHLFEEAGALQQVLLHAKRWFRRFLSPPGADAGLVFANRCEAGRRLVPLLMKFGDQNPIVLALPRGGVPVGFEVAQSLNAPLDVVLVRKIGAPGHKELGLGAVVGGAHAQVVMNDAIVDAVQPSPAYLEAEISRQLAEIERRRHIYRGEDPPLDIAGRTVIVIDDGIATGGTMKAVLKALARLEPRRLVLAVPVAPGDSLSTLSSDADDIICLLAPDAFFAVGMHYRDFHQISDQEVVDLLHRAKANGSKTHSSA
jgi:putative phosphoribosyl transferase